jgi:hypothetical protein
MVPQRWVRSRRFPQPWCITFTFSKRPVSVHGNVPFYLLQCLSALLNAVREGKGSTSIVPVVNLAARC